MKLLLLSGVYDETLEQLIQKKTTSYYDIAALSFERKLHSGFTSLGEDIGILSAPFIGSFPNRSKILYFDEDSNDERIEYVSFNNIWGVRNISRYMQLKKAIKKHLESDGLLGIVGYSSHVPFLETIKYAKEKKRNIKTCLIIPDLPEFVNLNGNWFYKAAKKIDIRRFYKLQKYVDCYVLLTDKMREYIDTKDKSYIVVPGIVDDGLCDVESCPKKKQIIFTGNLGTEYGIINLLDAFQNLERNDYDLIICGGGENEDVIKEKAAKNHRIKYLGVVPLQTARKLMKESKILVSPRMNKGEYTKYSFPSKLTEYMCAGGIVVTYELDGMTEEMKDCFVLAKEQNVKGLKDALEYAMDLDDEAAQRIQNYCIEYLKNNMVASVVAQKIREMLF